MPSTYSPSLRLELIGAGEQAGVWNVTSNNNLGDLIEQAIAGRTTINVTAGDVTLTSLNGVVDEARSAVLAVTGTPGVTRVITIPDASKSYTVINTTTNIVQIKTAAGVAFDCAPSATSVVSCDGSNGVQGSTIASLTSPALTGTPTAPTAAVTTNTTQIATTAFVNAEIANDAPTKTGGGASGTWGISITGNASGNAGTATTLQTARNINGTSFNGSADISTANWGTARTLTVGSTGKSVNGSGNVSWSLGEIGAPSVTGSGASGTWGINVTGNAASVTNGVYNNSGTYNINITGNANNITQYSINQNLNTTASVTFTLTQTEQLNVNTTQLYAATVSALSGLSYTYASARTGVGSEGHVVFQNGNGAVGTIFTNGSSTIYNTASDYRLKEITGALTDSGVFIDALKPKVGVWKRDNAPFVGFLAHEFQEVSPSSVTGQKDEVGADGKPVYQGMQAASVEVMANVIAELQSLRKRVAELEAL